MTNAIRLFGLMAVLAATTAADAPRLAVLNSVEAGRWTLSSRDRDFGARALCVTDPRVLLELRQPSAGCSRFVIANDANSATIHYTCPGAGHGRTTLRLETPRLAQIATQGLTGGSPFDYQIEARRTGACAAGTR